MVQSRKAYIRGDVIKKRRKRALLRAFWIGISSIIIIASGIFCLRQPPLQIVSYEVSGVVESNERNIREIMDSYIYEERHTLVPLNTFFTLPTNLIENLILNDHVIAEVKVSRSFSYPFKVKVEIKEKEIAHTFCLISIGEDGLGSCNWFGLDTDGYVVKKLVGRESSPSTNSSYISMNSDLLSDSGVLGKQIINKDIIDSIFLYSEMLGKFNYIATRYQIFDTKTYIFVEGNGYVIVPYGFSTHIDAENHSSDITNKIIYLESVISDSNISKNMYSTVGSSTKVQAKKDGTSTSTEDLGKIKFQYIDARIAKKIFINPGIAGGDQGATSTKATSTKPN